MIRTLTIAAVIGSVLGCLLTMLTVDLGELARATYAIALTPKAES